MYQVQSSLSATQLPRSSRNSDIHKFWDRPHSFLRYNMNNWTVQLFANRTQILLLLITQLVPSASFLCFTTIGTEVVFYITETAGTCKSAQHFSKSRTIYCTHADNSFDSIHKQSHYYTEDLLPLQSYTVTKPIFHWTVHNSHQRLKGLSVQLPKKNAFSNEHNQFEQKQF